MHNYAETEIKFLNEMVYNAYNIAQMFYFIMDTMDSYFQRKLVSIASNHLESYFS